MFKPQSRSVWLGLALVMVFSAVPLFADPNPISDLFTLFGQVSSTAATNGLGFGERTSLVTKIIAAIADIERGHENAARGSLGAFSNEVAALERSGRLPSADAAALIAASNAIIGQL